MKSTFLKDDVVLLLKDITGLIEPLPAEKRERNIQCGMHYSEMLPKEYNPTEEYLKIYENALKIFGRPTADAVVAVSEKIVSAKGKDVVIVSLARAGTPTGILISRYIRKKYGYRCPHFSISIIRDKGIDKNALQYILNLYPAECIQFVDGWTGKGTIFKELKKEISGIDGLSDSFAVLADPAYLTDMCGTHEDILIPGSCLNSTVCGLISRTLLRKDIIGSDDFHGAAYYKELECEDKTYEYIDHIEALFRTTPLSEKSSGNDYNSGINDIKMISEKYSIENINYIKPGIGETTRVLLRRIPWKIVIDKRYRNSIELEHIKQLITEKGGGIEYLTLNNYKCCGLIKQLSDI